jgi:hypothetical protein
MPHPANIEATLEDRAAHARQAQREHLMRQMKSLLKPDDLDIGRTYGEILEQIAIVVEEERAAHAVPPAPADASPPPEERPDASH